MLFVSGSVRIVVANWELLHLYHRARALACVWIVSLCASVGCDRERAAGERLPEPVVAPDVAASDVRDSTHHVPQVASVATFDPAGLPDESVITDIARYGAQDTARIVIFLSRPARYQVGRLKAAGGKGPRLFIDVIDVAYTLAKQFDVGGVVQRVRVGQQPNATRVVLDLREDVVERVFFLPEPFRLIVDVSTSREGSSAMRVRKPADVSRVVLDPGHGGHDPGAIGATGLMEKDVALDVALRAAPLIARELGLSALVTRETDEFVPLDERVARANAFHADLFISIHCNASRTADSHGVMTFVLDSSRDKVALQVAARENDASEAASTQLAQAMRQVMDSRTTQTSAHFARLLQRASLASLQAEYPGVVDGGVRQAGFYVLAGAHMPAVLFEASFISNPTEELRLESADYRQRLADGVVNAIRAYQSGL